MVPMFVLYFPIVLINNLVHVSRPHSLPSFSALYDPTKFPCVTKTQNPRVLACVYCVPSTPLPVCECVCNFACVCGSRAVAAVVGAGDARAPRARRTPLLWISGTPSSIRYARDA